MRFSVVLMFEQGRPRARSEITKAPPVFGDLCVNYRGETSRNRPVRVARLLSDHDIQEDVLPPLEIAELVGMSPVAFTLSGVERVGGTYFAQTWLVRLVPAERTVDPAKMHPATRRRLGL